MANDADVGLGDAEKPGDICAGLFVVEAHDDDPALPLLKALHAALEPLVIEPGRPGRGWGERFGAELLEQLFSSLCAAANFEDSHAACSKDKRGKLFRLAEAASAQGLKNDDKDLLHEVLGGVVVAKMAQAVKTDARSHAAADLRLGFRVMTLADAKHQIGVAEFE